MRANRSSPQKSPNLEGSEGGSRKAEESSSSQVAHTLTACVRCRKRKQKCDPGLPRCTPCERANSVCEYFDAARNAKISRGYVVHLQRKVINLEAQLSALYRDEHAPNPEEVVSGGAVVRLQESPESKFLGPSSGIAITRLIMQLAKHFTDSQSISEIVSKATAQHAKEQYAQEESKPDSKVYPLISNVAAEGLPKWELTRPLVELFNVKVQHMYPLFHEPTLLKDVEEAYKGSSDAYQNFVTRMVIAIGLQKLATQWAGLADSYYLAALNYFEKVLRMMNLKTLQCLGIIAEYSLLTPTRTASFHIVGIAARLVQALGLHEESTILRDRTGSRPNPLEIDMRRRLFWSIYVMDCGLSHSLGRPSMFAMAQEHVDVKWFETVADEYITENGVLDEAPGPSLKKWISIHFFKMRMLQLEIRRKLYLKKRPEPKDDSHPWFKQMEEKLIEWRDTSPVDEGMTGLDKAWFNGRYNTMIVFLFRPSPQVPRPSTAAAMQCFEACKYNLYMHREQIRQGNVDLTWILTQSLFMALNTMLWSLSYSEVRRQHPREEVRQYLDIALHCMGPAAERWPGVASASELYQNLIEACLKVYEKDGDIPISTSSPSENSSSPPPPDSDGRSRSTTTSPMTVPNYPVDTQQSNRSLSQGYVSTSKATSPEDLQTPAFSPQQTPSPSRMSSTSSHSMPSSAATPSARTSIPTLDFGGIAPYQAYDPSSHMNLLPTNFPDLFSWDQMYTMAPGTHGMLQGSQPQYNTANTIFHTTTGPSISSHSDYFYNQHHPFSWPSEGLVEPQMPSATGLNQAQQVELLQSLETDGMEHVESMIQAGNAIFNPSSRS